MRSEGEQCSLPYTIMLRSIFELWMPEVSSEVVENILWKLENLEEIREVTEDNRMTNEEKLLIERVTSIIAFYIRRGARR